MSEEKKRSWRSILADTLASYIPTAKASSQQMSSKVHYDRFSKTPIFEEIAKESEDILTSRDLFQGFKVEVQRHIAENFIVGHTLNIGVSQDPKKPKRIYGFISQLALPNSFVFGRFTSMKDHTARMIIMIDKNHEITIGADSQPAQGGEMKSFSIEGNHKGRENVANFKFSFEDHPQGSGIYFELGYVKRLLHLLAVGYNLTYIPSNAAVIMGGCIRIEKSMLEDPELYSLLKQRKTRVKNRLKNIKKVRPIIPDEQEILDEVLFEPKCFATANFQSGNIELTYTNQISKKLGLSTSLTISPPSPFQQRPGYSAAWKAGFKFSTGHVTAKGIVTDFTVFESILEQKMHDLLTVSVSSQSDISKDLYNFGVGIDLSF